MKPLPVLVVEDDKSLREALLDTLELSGYTVRAAADGSEALALLAREPIGLIVSDVQMRPMGGYELLLAVKQQCPHVPFLLMTAYGDIQRAVQAMRDGAAHYLLKPFEPTTLLAEVARFMLPARQDDDAGLVAEDPKSVELLALAKRVAASDATVLLTGESGVGKEVYARYLHAQSPRAKGPFVAINCAAIPEQLLESTLFGHEKGAFTGANQAHAGKFEQAEGGTLLLDEISEMPLGLQAKLLRVLQERQLERVGGTRSVKLDIRVLATSNRDMQAEVAAHRFREDLYYRLNVFPLAIPPLRERPQDIVLLARHLLDRYAQRDQRPGAGFDQGAERALRAHPWPGNIRELENVVQRALILSPTGLIQASHLLLPAPQPSAPVVDAPERSLDDGPAESADIRANQKRLILETLAATNGVRKLAAERLGISERTLRYKLQQFREEGEDV
ncbi:two-component system response regulator FlrC [Chitinivorax tropicus]|uniref:Two-component system response regulator FlrC n=1 Tax=Chitinivorax tropicus TaxID=714531 RepID=A0A840ML34_9PROT|nr:sigma-54 dependent transcriptional regulator [Chitinivorax tropicus]MBB5019874.1 two-component system response regulator FlrC [Chitinivorax tropicus]